MEKDRGKEGAKGKKEKEKRRKTNDVYHFACFSC
jgi:hypothetical protein